MVQESKTEQEMLHIGVLDDQPMWRTTTVTLCSDILTGFAAEKGKSINEIAKFHLAANVDEATDLLNNQRIHLLFLDKDLGVDSEKNKISGINFIQQFKSIQPFCQVIMLTADNSLRDMAQAFRNGASDYLFKSNDSEQREYRTEVIKKALSTYVDEINRTKSLLGVPGKMYSNYVCRSVAMQRFDKRLTAMSESSRSALIIGPTGSGKGEAARRVNELTRIFLGQEKRSFIQINIGGAEKSLAESILFGTEPGAYTDAAKQTKAGLLDLARDGDLFFDEIGDLSLDLQLKLLKVIEEKEYYRVGGNKPVKTNARFIFATNRDLQAMIAAKQFREDFYMRISVFEEALPSLNDRKDDVPQMIEGFLQSACTEAKKKIVSVEDFPADLMKYFLREDITGSIRGIENDVQRLIAHSKYDENGRPDLLQWK